MTPHHRANDPFAARTLTPLLRRRWGFVLSARIMVVAAVLLLARDGSRLGADADVLTTALLASVLPWHALMGLLLARRSRLPWYLSFADATIMAAAAALVAPQMWPVAVAAGPAIVAIEAMLAGRRWASACAAYTIGVFAVSGQLAEASYVPATVLAMAVATFAIATFVGSGVEQQRDRLASQDRLLADVPGLVWEHTDGDALVLRGKIRELLGYGVTEWSRVESPTTLIHPDDLSVFQPAATMSLTEGDALVREFRMRRRDGRWMWLRDTVRSQDLPDGRRALQGVSLDVTAEKQAAEAIDQMGQVLGRMAQPVHVLEFDPELTDLSIVHANTDAGPLDVADRELIAAARSAVTTREQVISLERGFEIWPIDDQRCVLVLSEPEPAAPVPVPSRDGLTDLPDRATLRLRLEQIFRRNPQARVALLVLDLDQFKEVNDTLGHAQGDELLRAIAARVQEVATDNDLVCRLGGDEFALLLVDDGPERAQLVAADLETTIAHPIVLDGVHIQAGVSIGAACSPDHGTDADMLLQRADVAMYQAKSAGESYRLYDRSDDRFTVRRLTLLGELPRALRNGEMIVHYQPKIDLRASSVIGVEALVRWQHPEHGMIPPDEFIELAEVSGLVRELTRQVILESVAQLRRWDDEGIHLTVAVNLSVRNFTDADLPVWVEQCLDDNEIEPGRLMLEITESEVMDDVVLALGVLERLSSLGVRSSIDDFGTGYSSLSYLRQLPIDEIKIDRSFVGTMAVNPHDTVIVRSIIELGHNLDLDVVAEGVEDEWTLDSLRSLGCDQAQGYYFSRPVPPEELVTFVSQFTDASIVLH